jgi:hypothetical protein
MKRKAGQNPYRDFKSYRERRRALNTLAWSRAIPAMLAALAMAAVQWIELIRWLMHRLFERVAALNADKQSNNMPIVLIKDLVHKCLAEPLRKAGYLVPQAEKIGFPRWERDPLTIAGIKSALATAVVSRIVTVA